MTARDPHEPHRASTPLECLVDLCFVVAVSQAAAKLHHGLIEGHITASISGYCLVFFAIWWAWVNFTWFASAYDTDDVPFRLLALLEIAGVLVLAAGVPRAFDEHDFSVATYGYVIMRVALVANWLRAARNDAPRRRTALRYATGLSVLQIGWLGLLALPPASDLHLALFLVMVVAELLVPVWAEHHATTSWHPHHIAERYGLLTLIVLGESAASATVAIQTAVDSGHFSAAFAGLTVGGLLILFSMWWLYFDEPAHELLVSSRVAFQWGYGHYVVFASTAAVGAALGVAADALRGRTELPTWAVGAAVAGPVTIYILSVWALHVRPRRRSRLAAPAFFVTAGLVLASSVSEWAVLLIGLLLSGLVAAKVLSGVRGSAEAAVESDSLL